MKKKTLLISGIVVLPIMWMSVFLYKADDQSSYEELIKKGNQIAMYIEGEDGEYSLSQDNKFPTEGYVLNTERSSCTNGGTLSQNPKTKKIKVNVSNIGSCSLYFEKGIITLANGLKANIEKIDDYEGGITTEMYTFEHDKLTTTITDSEGTSYTYSATQVADWTSEERKDYRYIGANPSNYVTFNDETWRIIGVFTVETESGSKEQLIKIIRNEPIGDISRSTIASNDWSISSLQDLLNDTYYNTEASFDYTFTDRNNVQHTITIEKGLNETARGQITNVKWYLGSSNAYNNLGAQDYYAFERGEKTCVTEGMCSGQTRPTSIMRKVGLMYASDYAYTYGKEVDEKCYTDGFNCSTSQGGTPSAGWIYNESFAQWTQNPNRVNNSFRVNSTGTIGIYDSRFVFGVRPVVFLSSSTHITGGDGSQRNPYILG